MRSNLSIFIAALAAVVAISCTKPSPEEAAKISLSSQYADMSGADGAEASVSITTNYDNVTATKDDVADWLECTLSGKVVTVRALSANEDSKERFVNITVVVRGNTPSNMAAATFTARQRSNSDEVQIIPEKTKPIISAGARGVNSGYSGEDNRYRLAVTLVNADDIDISWDKSVAWLLDIEKYYDESEAFAGIMFSVTLNNTKESRSTKITLSVPGVEYAAKEITLFQKSDPFNVNVGDYDKNAGGTVIYLDVENYSFYLVLDNVQAKLPFVSSNTLDLTNTASTEHSGKIAEYYGGQGDSFFNAENFPAFFYAFNRNNTSGKAYTKYSEVPADVVSDETKWHMMSRSELAYVFKRTLLGQYCTQQSDTHTFNEVLDANASANGVTIDHIATSGTIYWSSYAGTNKDNYVTAFATTNLKYSAADNKKNYAFYRPDETTKSYVRCVKKVFVE